MQEILQVYEREKNYVGTARIVGVGANTVRDHVNSARKESEAHRASDKGNEDQVALKVYSLLESGKSMIQVALILGLRAEVVEKYHVEYRRLKVQDSLIRSYNLLKERGFERGLHVILDLAEEVMKGNYTEDQVKETLRKVASRWKLDEEIKSLFGARDQVVEECAQANEDLDKVNSELDEKNELVKGAEKKIAEMDRAASNQKHEREEAAKIPPELLSLKGRREAILNFKIELIPILKPSGALDLVELALEAFIETAVEDPELLEYLKRASTAGPDKIPPPPPALILAFSAEVGKRCARRASQKEREKTSQGDLMLPKKC